VKLAISLVADFSQYTLGNSTHAREIVHKLELSSVLTIVDGLCAIVIVIISFFILIFFFFFNRTYTG